MKLESLPDLYLIVYKVPEDAGDWVEVERSAGIHIDGGQIAYVEFRTL